MKEAITLFLKEKPYSIPFFILLFLNMTGWAIALFCIYLLNHDL